jgi:hypothetical protein
MTRSGQLRDLALQLLCRSHQSDWDQLLNQGDPCLSIELVKLLAAQDVDGSFHPSLLPSFP